MSIYHTRHGQGINPSDNPVDPSPGTNEDGLEGIALERAAVTTAAFAASTGQAGLDQGNKAKANLTKAPKKGPRDFNARASRNQKR